MNWYTIALISIGAAIGIHLYDHLNNQLKNNYKPFKNKNFDLIIICIVVFLIAVYVILTEHIKYPF